MDDKRKSLQKPASKNVRARAPISPTEARSIRPDGSATETSKNAVRSLRLRRRRVVLYRDEEVIQEIRNQVVASALRSKRIWDRLKRAVMGQSLLSWDFTLDGLAGVDEFVLKPIMKWTLGGEVGVEAELKWSLGGEKNIDNLILTLFSMLPPKRVSELTHQVKAQRQDTPVDDLVYPGMPINTFGIVRHKDDLLPKEIHLHIGKYRVQIEFSQEHNLAQAATLLGGRTLYALGIVKSIEKILIIRGGAVLIE